MPVGPIPRGDSGVSERKQLLSLLDNGTINTCFQAILDLNNNTLAGYEALARCPPDSAFASTEALFAAALRENLLAELNACCIAVAVRAFRQLELPGKLFLNTIPGALSRVVDAMGPVPASWYRERVVLEISEKYPLEDMQGVNTYAHQANELGIEVALDDLGTGYSGLKTWSLVRPDYVKIDRHFISGIHLDPVKREFVRSISEIARSLRCRVIAEGIELEEELATLRSLHIRYGQGYLIHYPEEAPRAVLDMLALHGGRADGSPTVFSRPSETVAALMEDVEPLPADTCAEQVNNIFTKNAAITALPVVENGKPIGIISRKQLMERFSQRYSFALLSRKPIVLFADKNTLVVDWQTPMQEVSRLITGASGGDMNLDFIITRDGDYAGVGKVATLLKHITDMQMRSARHSNPLTQLPGNVPIHEQVDDLLKTGADFHFAYIDINDFKPFNDYYGYSLGDEIINCLARIIVAATNRSLDFVGHIGGDDFVVLFRCDNWQAKCSTILAEFEREVQRFYSPGELAAGGIYCRDRQGRETLCPLLSLAIGVVHPDPALCFSQHDVATLASEAKHQAKLAAGNHLFFSRRRAPQRAVVDGATTACLTADGAGAARSARLPAPATQRGCKPG